MRIEVELSERDLNRLGKMIAQQVALEMGPIISEQLHIKTESIKNREPLPEQQFFRIKDLVIRTGLSRSTIYKQVSDGRFPKSIKLGERCSAWSAEDIKMWEQSTMSRSR